MMSLVIRMDAVVDDAMRTITRSQTTQVSKTLLGYHNVEVMLGVVDMLGVRNNAADTGRVGFGRTNRGRMHDLQEAGAQEVTRPADCRSQCGYR